MHTSWKIITILLLFIITGCSRHSELILLGFIEGEFTYLSSSVSGNLSQLLVYRGDPVKQGQKLFALDAMPERAQLQQAEFRLAEAQQNLANLMQGQRSTILEGISAQQAQAQADLTFAQQTLARNQALFRAKVISKSTLDEATANYNRTAERVKQFMANLAEAKLGARAHQILAQQAAVEAAKADVERARWFLEQKIVYAPFTSRVYDTFYKIGEFVPSGQAVLAILLAKDIKVIFYLPEPLLSTVKIGREITFRCDSCRQLTSAKITYISPQAEYTPPVIYSKDTRYKLVFRIEARMTPEDAVKFNPGQPIEVEIKK